MIKPDVPGDISLMIGGGYVGLEVSLISSTVYGISGISPQKTWKKADLTYPEARQGQLKVIFGSAVQRGVGIDLATAGEIFYDANTGVVCIGDPAFPHDAENVEFADRTVATVADGSLVAVRLRPAFVK